MGRRRRPPAGWLWLIAALEVLAVHEDEENVTLVDALRAMQKEGGEPIDPAWAAAAPADIAAALVRTQRATAKFRAFIRKYQPAPPAKRIADQLYRLDWDQVEAAMNTVYGHRSALVHSGRAMPPGMVGSDLEQWDGPPPECVGTTIGAYDTQWCTKDVPMHLWVAAYITRGAILNWWVGQTP